MKDEYIKREDAMKALDEYRLSQTMSKYGDMEMLIEVRDGVVGAMNALAFVPTADVVPKSEVEELKADLEVWKQNRFNIFQMLELYKMTKQEVASEIFAEIDRAVENAELEWGTICGVKLCIAELKKKYTEEQV